MAWLTLLLASSAIGDVTLTDTVDEPIPSLETSTAGSADSMRRALESAPAAEENADGLEPEPVQPVELIPEIPEAESEQASEEEIVQQEQDELLERREILEDIEESITEEITVADLPEPCTGPWDWVHLSSGEWLRGEFKRMRKKRFSFRSTRMKTQTLDWKHVKAFCFPGNTRFILEDHTVMAGQGRLVDGLLTVSTDEITQTAPREDIWAILPGLPRELNRWRSKLSVGLDAFTGNTDQQNFTASVEIDREDAGTHLDLDYRGSFGRTDGKQNVNRHRATGEFNVYFNRRVFAALPFIEYTSDHFQNLQHRVTPGASLGYKLFDSDSFEWDVQVGWAYQYTRFVSVQPDQALAESDSGPRFMANLDWDVWGDLTWKASHSTILLVLNFDQSNYHTQTSLVYDLTDLIYLEFSFWHDRTRQPQETQSGDFPKKDDFRYLVSVGVSFD